MGIADRVIAAIETNAGQETTDVAALRAEVEGLKRAIAVIVARMHSQDAEAVLHAVQRVPEPEEEPRQMLSSAYRGAQPDDGELRCVMCRRKIEADDPELSLETAGRVCMSCYQRSQV